MYKYITHLLFLHSARSTGGLNTVNNDTSSATDSKDLRAKVSHAPASLPSVIIVVDFFFNFFHFSWFCIACGISMAAVYLGPPFQDSRAKVFDNSH